MRCGGFGRKTRVAGCLLAACIVAALWQGADRVAVGSASGEGFHAASPHSPRPNHSPAAHSGAFRVATFNIHSGRGADSLVDLNRTAGCLAPQGLPAQSIIGLNEVQGPTFRGDANQAQLLGDMLNAAWLFAPTERRWWREHFGNAVLATCPVGSWLRIPLPSTGGKGFRNALLLTIRPGERPGDRPVQLLVTHLDRTQDRELQLAAVSSLFLSLAEPAILIGDLNTTRGDPALRELLAVPGVQDAVAAGSRDDIPDRIDWILVRGLRIVNAAVVPGNASDHPLVWADCAFPDRE